VAIVVFQMKPFVDALRVALQLEEEDALMSTKVMYTYTKACEVLLECVPSVILQVVMLLRQSSIADCDPELDTTPKTATILSILSSAAMVGFVVTTIVYDLDCDPLNRMKSPQIYGCTHRASEASAKKLSYPTTFFLCASGADGRSKRAREQPPSFARAERAGDACDANNRTSREARISSFGGKKRYLSCSGSSVAGASRILGWRGRERCERKDHRVSLLLSLLPLLFCGRSGQVRGLSGGDPPNPPCSRRGRSCARPLMRSAAHVHGRTGCCETDWGGTRRTNDLLHVFSLRSHAAPLACCSARMLLRSHAASPAPRSH
jgi:hypothetical protein